MNKYEFYIDGTEYQQAYLNTMASAKKNICIQTYIFQLDSFGNKVYELLCQKAKEGVSVNLVIDSIGSFHLNSQIKNKFNSAKNLKIHFFNPLLSAKIFQVGRRLHHKILIVDGYDAIVGGINIVNALDSKIHRFSRLDFAIRVQGPSVKSLLSYCNTVGEPFLKKSEIDEIPEIHREGDPSISFKYNDWFNGKKQITKRYSELIKSSRKSIFLIHGYFFPSRKILKSLIEKSRDGVKVHLILPKYSDWPSWIYATEYLYKKLLKNGIDVQEWQLSDLHGKLGIFDQKTIFVGSHNLNYTSTYGNIETNVEIHNTDFIKKIINKEINYIMKGCRQITDISNAKRSFASRIHIFFFYSLLVLFASTSINFIKFSRKIKNVRTRKILLLLLILFFGFLGFLLLLNFN